MSLRNTRSSSTLPPSSPPLHALSTIDPNLNTSSPVLDPFYAHTSSDPFLSGYASTNGNSFVRGRSGNLEECGGSEDGAGDAREKHTAYYQPAPAGTPSSTKYVQGDASSCLFGDGSSQIESTYGYDPDSTGRSTYHIEGAGTYESEKHQYETEVSV